MIRIRIIKDIEGPQVSYQAGQVVSIVDASGQNLITAGFACSEPPSPSGAIGTLYNNAGFIRLQPYASGYVGPSGFISDVPAGQPGFYCSDDYTITVVMPGKVETTFSILKMRPKLN